jgi:Carboxypeptidase regulatory-like domain
MKVPASVCLLIVLVDASARAQTPTGKIIGIITDASRAVAPDVQLKIVNADTGQVRGAVTSVEGRYAVDFLQPGTYRVTAEAPGFKQLQRDAEVEAGTTTTVDMTLEVGAISESMTVSGAVPLLRTDHHQVAGVIHRELIDNLPLNGRNFLELAKLEPGVTILARASNNRILVPVLSAGLQTLPRIGYTAVTVDGGSVSLPGTLGSAMQVSQEVIQEFQISTVNFDASTNPTSIGAINIVTRSGGNAYRGSGFYFYRDHSLSAYPGLRRDPRNPDPFFKRGQSGASIGGPIRRDRAFFFASYERTDQDGVFSVQPPQFPALGGIFPSPYDGTQLSARVDARLHPNHNVFVRFTHDGNSAFTPGSGSGSATLLPSAWSRLRNDIDQTMLGITSTLSANTVNDFRVSYFLGKALENPADPNECSDCIGLAAPRIMIDRAGLAVGSARTLSFVGRRFQLSESLAWQKGHHGLRFGVNWEHSTVTDSSVENDPAQITLWSPQAVRQFNQGAPQNARIPLPASFVTLDDILQLPLRSFRTSVGPPEALQRGFAKNRVIDLYRLFASDMWRAHSRLTVNAGLGWAYEPNALNDDLTKPALLVPILGIDGLKPPAVHATNFSPTLGLAWMATRDARTVVHAGVGQYYDPIGSTNSGNLLTERYALSPLGTGRLTASGSNITLNGQTLDFPVPPTSFTGAQLLAALPEIRSHLSAALNPDNRDFSTRNLDRIKEASNLFDPDYRTPYAVHVNVGIRRELESRLVVNADVVLKRFVNTFLSAIDYNRWNSAGGPTIPACTAEQRDDVSVPCSNGPITFSNTAGRARYRGLLVRVNTDVSPGVQVQASYALGSYVGINGPGTATTGTGFNNNNWTENYGPLPTDIRHTLNVAGFVALPWKFQMAFSLSAYSRPPLSAYVNAADFNGDGTTNDLLPGTSVNQLGRGIDKSDLKLLVDRYNTLYSRSPITLPLTYSFNDTLTTTDLRITQTFTLNRGLRLSLIGEVFNVFNTANLVQYSGNIADPTSFGQPGARFDQVFGSGGPRAIQLGARLRF